MAVLMASPSKGIKTWFVESLWSGISELYSSSGIEKSHVMGSISVPKKEFGDLGCSIALRIAKAQGMRPSDVAKALIEKIGKNDLVSDVRETGGYINISLNVKEYSAQVLGGIEKDGDSYGSSKLGEKSKVLVEYPAVNPNKPWHIGHLRNALIGDAISNIMDFCGYTVEREDYIDDLGLQIAESLWGYESLGGKPDKKFDQWLGERYVEVNKVMKEKRLDDQMGALLKRMEDVGSRESLLARQIASKCVDAQYETACRYGVYHDVMIWESDIVKEKLLKKSLDLALRNGALEKRESGKNAGCIVLDLNKVRDMAKDFENPEETDKIIVRSDGTATYVAKDIAFHMWKLGLVDASFKYKHIGKEGGRELYSTSSEGKDMDFGKADLVVNVIGSAQRYPQLVLKAVFSLMGHEKEAERIVHVAYGEVSVEGGSLSGREGGWMGSGKAFTADSLLNEATSKAYEATLESKKIVKENVQDIACAIGRSAIRFEFLKVSPHKAVVFSWKSALNFEGNSGPYCMYTFARAKSILKKAGYRRMELDKINLDMIEHSYDFELIKLLGEAQEVVEKSAQEYSPNVIADYISLLTVNFSKFYESMKVIGSGGAQDARLRLLDAYVQVTKNMFGLLGIDAVESM